MSGLKQIKNRIQSVKNTQQITKAMKMVSASKLRKAQYNIESAREYSERLKDMIISLGSLQGEVNSPLLAVREKGKAVIVVITSDKGLCGALNTNLCKLVFSNMDEIKSEYDELEFYFLGKKGRDYFKRRGILANKEYTDLKDQERESAVGEIFHDLIGRYSDEEINAVYVCFNRFNSVISQEQQIYKILPLSRFETSEEISKHNDYFFEPNAQVILDKIMPDYVRNIGYTGLLDHMASEHGSRMTAMDAATRNAGEMISKLRLYYNRARQAAITTELTEIISGAESINQ